MLSRKIVEKNSAVVGVFFKLYSVFPAFIKRFLYDLSAPYSGYVALLNRYFFLKNRASRIGRSVYIGRNVVLKNTSKALLGDNLSIHDMCYIDAQGGLIIGDNVSIAHQTSILTFNHTWSDPGLPIKYNPVELAPVVIEDDVWIGCGVRIMPGVTIGSRSVVAAGAVVTKNVPPGVLVAGVPAKVLRSIAP